MNNKIVNTVYQTNDYDMFHELLGNREVLDSRVNKIKKSIQENGYIFNPIIVNEKMEVIDGQGRLMALRELQLPVDYIIVHGLNADNCIALNIASSNWTNADYIHCYVSQGNHNYENFSMLVDEYKRIGIVSIVSALTGTCDNKSKRLQRGQLVCTDEDVFRVTDMLSYANCFVDIIINNKKGSKDYILYALFFAYLHSGINREKLYKNFEKYYAIDAITPCFINLKSALKSLSAIYNYKSKTERVYLDIDYEKWQEGRYGWYSIRYGSLSRNAI